MRYCLLDRDDEEQVPLHNDRSVEDLYTAPGNKKTGGRTGLGAISNEPAPAERSGLSGNSMGNYNPEYEISANRVTLSLFPLTEHPIHRQRRLTMGP